MDYDKYYFHNVDISVPFYGMTIIINYIFFAQEKPKFWHTPTHCHAGYELHSIPQGRGVLKIDNESYDIRPGSMFLIGPGIYHEITSDNAEAMSQHCISFDIDFGSGAEKRVKDFLLQENKELNTFFKELSVWIGSDRHCGELFDELHKEFLTPVIGSYAYICSTLTRLIIEFIRCSTNNRESHYKIPRKSSDEVRKILIDEAFNKNYADLTKNRLSEELHISIRQLERIINQYYGMSFYEKLIHSRIENAKVQLSQTSHSMEKIAESTGFPSTGSFLSAFKKTVNMTPGNYRQSKRKT